MPSATNSHSQKKQVALVDPKIDSAMTTFWGKELSDWDLQVCAALGWIVEHQLGRETVWLPIAEIKAFEGKIYTNNKVTGFLCDDLLREYTCRNAFVCLDPYFGTEGRRAALRVLLTFVTLCVHDYAIHVASDDKILFAAKQSLANSPRQSKLLRACARDGLIIPELIDNKLCWTVTPKGLWFDRVEDGKGDALNGIRLRLEKEDLIRRTVDKTGKVRWRPTVKGYKYDLNSTDKTLSALLIELGMDELLPNCES